MIVTVLLFAAAREQAGTESVAVKLSQGATVGELRTELVRQLPTLAGLLARSALALNQDFADRDQVVRAGDEVAIIPPVSGG